ncbi:AIPR family protein [Actinoplanes sp. Pm04-4]|uniref:AIPR family protein n=1 Tax=Paractinoplanes pyxinae TaxID=2997416 RepID=A0ABT4B8Z1_9ACTN|nr:AIPR family protein [Actinoplanes pyxinae]MCY1142345.1 AIPR family protein [Actinoplanes pyxinae]
MNNGVTIVCSKATAVGKTYSLDDVQVVNGLQSSHTIFNVLRSAAADHPALDRSILVRILVTGNDAATRDLVIRATNRQTSVPAASLRATDDVQRDIEAFFLGQDWYYDRRKNFYRNMGRSAERIVSISLLAQAVMAMGLSRWSLRQSSSAPRCTTRSSSAGWPRPTCRWPTRTYPPAWP